MARTPNELALETAKADHEHLLRRLRQATKVADQADEVARHLRHEQQHLQQLAHESAHSIVRITAGGSL